MEDCQTLQDFVVWLSKVFMGKSLLSVDSEKVHIRASQKSNSLSQFLIVSHLVLITYQNLSPCKFDSKHQRRYMLKRHLSLLVSALPYISPVSNIMSHLLSYDKLYKISTNEVYISFLAMHTLSLRFSRCAL